MLTPPNFVRLWLSPVLLGILLILVGALLIAAPALLAYFVASLFVLAGVLLIGLGATMRRRVTYRRIDETRGAYEDSDES